MAVRKNNIYVALAASIVSAGLVMACALRASHEPWAFLDPIPHVAASTTPALKGYTVNNPNDGLFVHAGSVVATEKGARAFWYHATYEGSADARIETSHFDGNGWSPQQTVTSAADVARDIGLTVKSVANPVPFRHPSGELWLFISVSRLSGWATTEIVLKRSRDDGATWGPATRLITSPFVNISHLTKTPPVLMANGLIGLPSYFEMRIKYPVFFVLDREGRVVDRRRMGAGGNVALQPSVVVTGPRSAVALMRRLKGANVHRVLMTRTSDGGETWTRPIPTNLPNPGGAVSAIRYDADRLLIAYNADPAEEMQIALAVSDLNGTRWRKIGEPVPENRLVQYDRVAYPYLARTGPGQYDVVYSRLLGKIIGHARFTDAWIAERLSSEGSPQ